MKRFASVAVFCLFVLGTPRQTPQQPPAPTPPPAQTPQQPVQGGGDSVQQVREDTEWVLGHFAKWVTRLNAATEAGKTMTYNDYQAKELAEIHLRARRMAVDWQAVFDNFWDKHTDKDTLTDNPKYERALVLAQEMVAIAGATQAAISEILKPQNADAFALDMVDFVGIYKRMEEARQ